MTYQEVQYSTYAQEQPDDYTTTDAVQYSEPPQANPYNTNVLETVQNATIGSAAVKYYTPTPPEPVQPDTTEPTPEEEVHMKEEDEPSELCRDFLHGLCDREDCRFKHDNSLRDNERAKLPVCKDYQKLKCHRVKCKYLHLTEEEEEAFEKTGVLPVKKDGDDTQDGNGVGEQCRDFMNGLCKRGVGCKYNHTPPPETGNNPFSLYGKRPYSLSTIGNIPDGSAEDENEKLKQRLLDLRKQVLELTQLNDALYSENIKFRQQLTGNNVLAEKMSLLPIPLSNNGFGH